MLQIYKASLRLAARLALQSEQQRELAVRALPRSDPVVIPSFAEPGPSPNGAGQYFLWADRLVEYKLPDRFVELAEALPEARFRMVACPGPETPPEWPSASRRRPSVSPTSSCCRPVAAASCSTRCGTPWRSSRSARRGRAQHVPGGLGPRRAGAVAERRPRCEDREQRHRRGGRRVDGAADRGAASLWRDPELRTAMGARARRFIQDVHSPEAVADRWVAMLEELI